MRKKSRLWAGHFLDRAAYIYRGRRGLAGGAPFVVSSLRVYASRERQSHKVRAAPRRVWRLLASSFSSWSVKSSAGSWGRAAASYVAPVALGIVWYIFSFVITTNVSTELLFRGRHHAAADVLHSSRAAYLQICGVFVAVEHRLKDIRWLISLLSNSITGYRASTISNFRLQAAVSWYCTLLYLGSGHFRGTASYSLGYKDLK